MHPSSALVHINFRRYDEHDGFTSCANIKRTLSIFSQAQTLTSTQLMFLVPYSIAIIMQTFTPNYFATHVIENSERLPEQAFSSNWFQLEYNERRAILLFMTRTMRPLVVCAGKLYQMNVSTFLKVLLVFESIRLFLVMMKCVFFIVDYKKCLFTIGCFEKHATLKWINIEIFYVTTFKKWQSI